MRRRLVAIVCVVAVLPAAAVAVGALRDPLAGIDPTEPAAESGRAHGFDVERVATGFNRPTWVGVAPGDPGALWVLEQPGRVVRLRGNRRSTVIDLTGETTTGAEQGLLGIAFHPDYATNRRLYLHWSDRAGDTRVAEFRGRRQVRELLSVEQVEPNHKGGQLAFGPDGRLYIGLGDGGGAFDPERYAQDPEDRHGKLLSTDVEGDSAWRVELIGLRNPWRFAFDPALGEVWIGDVGQDAVEEIDRVLLEPDEPPKNLGWSAFEGTERMDEGDDSLTDGELVWPVAQYTHDRRLLGHGRLRVPGDAAAAAGRSLPVRRLLLRRAVVAQGRAGGPRGRRPARARRRAAAHPHRARRRGRAAVRVGGRRDLPRRQSGATAVTGPSIETRTRSPGCQAGKPSRRLRSRRPLGSSSCTSWSCP